MYFSASSASVALMARAISAPVMVSIVVGIWVGSEVGRLPVTMTVPISRSWRGASCA
jgi:hypothetical protein